MKWKVIYIHQPLNLVESKKKVSTSLEKYLDYLGVVQVDFFKGGNHINFQQKNFHIFLHLKVTLNIFSILFTCKISYILGFKKLKKIE